ncbi:MAG: 4-(cytidine 5'-diphospho)-2-C-methyl-D-erythritol kinase [Bacteroidota bacterium]|nr:4-(cytidine 5'-diphospho)-2-C-methyl-D-erythritol kinase [Bacteroidota bacterium]
MIVAAHAKINLGLQVYRRREDGFHEIETVFHRVDIADELLLRKTERGIRCTTDAPSVPTDRRNLCVQAAEAFFALTGYTGGLDIHIHKVIPAGAGLGGGSSDAAALLRALPRLLGIRVSEDDLHALALSLGSDVPYFLHPGTAHARGRGEILTYFPLEIPYWVLIVYPGVPVSTAWAYGRYLFDPNRPAYDLRNLLIECIGNPAVLAERLRNDLEPIVFAAHPETRCAKESLYESGAAFALMSGSGSTVFGFFPDEGTARASAARFPASYSVFLTAPSFRPGVF